MFLKEKCMFSYTLDSSWTPIGLRLESNWTHFDLFFATIYVDLIGLYVESNWTRMYAVSYFFVLKTQIPGGQAV